MFAVSVYNLNNGDEVLHSEYDNREEATENYLVINKHFTNYCTDDCFGVMMYDDEESGNILYGF